MLLYQILAYSKINNCISKINNTQVDDAHDIDIVMPM